MSFGVATLRALVHAGDKTSGDARSWYMISGDAKSWVCDCSAYIHCHIAQLCVINKGKCEVLGIKDEYIWEFIEGQLFDFFQGREIVNFVNKLLQTMYGMILYLVQCESLCRIPVFSPLTLTGCDRLGNRRQGMLIGSNVIKGVPLIDMLRAEAFRLGYGAAKVVPLSRFEKIIPSTYEVKGSALRLMQIPALLSVQISPSPEWSLGSLPVSPSSLVVPSPIASLVATPVATISVDEDQFIEVGTQLELHWSILHDHTQRLDALPPTLFVDIDRDVRELYTRSGAVRDEIFSQRYRFRSLEREQERATMTFGALWRPVLALEAWAGHVDTRMANMSRARYDDHRLIHDMLVQQAAM
ncbi:hypothetical protein Tco_1038429 [Tanacetum coccineum]